MFSPVAARYPFAWHMHDTFVLNCRPGGIPMSCIPPSTMSLLASSCRSPPSSRSRRAAS
ncbi:unnamed protein product [Symbiodinium sp. CCMP2592]|nr:unnamed protein product [Symbiodinium sp. CCMP2592]